MQTIWLYPLSAEQIVQALENGGYSDLKVADMHNLECVSVGRNGLGAYVAVYSWRWFDKEDSGAWQTALVTVRVRDDKLVADY